MSTFKDFRVRPPSSRCDVAASSLGPAQRRAHLAGASALPVDNASHRSKREEASTVSSRNPVSRMCVRHDRRLYNIMLRQNPLFRRPRTSESSAFAEVESGNELVFLASSSSCTRWKPRLTTIWSMRASTLLRSASLGIDGISGSFIFRSLVLTLR